MPNVVKIEGFLLKKHRLSGQDTVTVIFTKEQGKISAYAKGVKKITSRRSPHLQTGNLLIITLDSKGTAQYVQQTTLVSAFGQLKQNVRKVEMLYFFLFLIDRLVPEGVPEPQLYNMTKQFIIELNKAPIFTRSEILPYMQEILLILGFSRDRRSFNETVQLIEEIIHEKLPLSII
ncbi:DNA repair protein RecO [Candidatus Roizmanbacteria bacterium]|nr:DNA repair protein RecO [Candidatus Roizmanbacteria bacterium]